MTTSPAWGSKVSLDVVVALASRRGRSVLPLMLNRFLADLYSAREGAWWYGGGVVIRP